METIQTELRNFIRKLKESGYSKEATLLSYSETFILMNQIPICVFVTIMPDLPGLMDLAIESGADCNLQLSNGKSALHMCVQKNQIKEARILLNAGAKPNLLDEGGMTPLDYTIGNASRELLSLLIESGAKSGKELLNITDEVRPVTAEEEGARLVEFEKLKQKAKEQDYTIVSKMLDQYTTSPHTWPLHIYFLDKEEIEITAWMLEHGASINPINAKGRTPLYIAAGLGYEKTVRLFCEHGAEVDIADIYGRTPLHNAAIFSQTETMQILIKYGADYNKLDKSNQKPLDLLKAKLIPEVKDYIKQLEDSKEGNKDTNKDDNTDRNKPSFVPVKENEEMSSLTEVAAEEATKTSDDAYMNILTEVLGALDL